MKYLLLLLGVLVLVWLVRKSRAARAFKARRVERPVEKMVRCTRCGVNQPLSEGVVVQGRYYCSSEHAPAAPDSKG